MSGRSRSIAWVLSVLLVAACRGRRGGGDDDENATDAAPGGDGDAGSAIGRATVTGAIEFVNAPAGATTSAVLVPSDGFVANEPRAALDSDLRADGVDASFSIERVPAGRYLLLVAWERDGLVLDLAEDSGVPTTVEVPDAEQVVDAGTFLVTSAIELIGPGAQGTETLSSTPIVFEWADDSGEDGYELHVYGPRGTELVRQAVPAGDGQTSLSVQWNGQGLQAGQLHAFRVESYRLVEGVRVPLSESERLSGTFLYSP